MCCRDGSQDPDRTERMRKREDQMVVYLQNERSRLSNEIPDEGIPDNWVNAYREMLTDMIESNVRDIRRYMSRTTDSSDSLTWKETVHVARRSIALLHQEEELISQGLDYSLLAYQADMSIPHGNRY